VIQTATKSEATSQAPVLPQSGAPLAAARESYFRRTFRSLENRNYRFLWLGMLCTMAAMNMQMVARGQLAWELTRSEFLTSLVGAGFAVPMLAFSLFGGAIADRVERKRLVQLGQLASSLNILWLALVIAFGEVQVWHLITGSLLQGVFWSFLMPARQSLIGQIVGKDLLGNAVALNASGMSLMTLIAPAIAGVLYARTGADGAYFAIAGVSFAAIIFTTMLPKLPAANVGRKSKRVVAEIREGLSYIGTNKTVLWLLAITLGTTVLSMPFRQLMPVYADRVFDRGAESVGLMLSVFGGGALLGTLLIAGLTKTQSRGTVMIWTTVVSGLGMIAIAVAPIYGLAVLLMLLPGLGESGRRSLNASLIMEQTDEQYQGRVMGVYMMNFGLIPLGALPMGAAAEAVGIQWTLGAAGALLLAVAAASTFGTSRIRRL
jgi:MFS family permease